MCGMFVRASLLAFRGRNMLGMVKNIPQRKGLTKWYNIHAHDSRTKRKTPLEEFLKNFIARAWTS